MHSVTYYDPGTITELLVFLKAHGDKGVRLVSGCLVSVGCDGTFDGCCAKQLDIGMILPEDDEV